MTDLDDTTRCPLGAQCASCDRADDLEVATLETSVGITCLTLCGDCGAAQRLPRLAIPTATRLVGAHCTHLGITLDEMAAAQHDP